LAGVVFLSFSRRLSSGIVVFIRWIVVYIRSLLRSGGVVFHQQFTRIMRAMKPTKKPEPENESEKGNVNHSPALKKSKAEAELKILKDYLRKNRPPKP